MMGELLQLERPRTVIEGDHPIPMAALEQHIGIIGRTGSGKSYTARGVVERLLDAGRRVCVIDPTGAWWGLRQLADGSGPSPYPVAIFGGTHGDMPLHERAGPALGRAIATRNMPVILDLSEMSKSAQRRFLTGFTESLFEKNRSVLHLIIDEADEYVPQRLYAEAATLFERIDRIVRRGRIRGFRVALITQRAAVIHKDVLSQIGTLVAMRSASPQDRKAVEGWIKGHATGIEAAQVLDSLASLEQGEGWVWAPEADVLSRSRFPANRTFDSSRTPEVGEDAPAPIALDQLDLEEFREALAEVVAEPAKPVQTAGLSDGERAQLKALSERVTAIEADRAAIADFIASTATAATAFDAMTAALRDLTAKARETGR
jgi:uncharacterized protein